MSTLHGPDLSSFQAALDLTRTPHDFAIVKATQGDWYTNPAFGTHMAQANGNPRGAYHFWETGKSVTAQVDRFLSVVKPHLDGLTWLVLDYEPGYNNDLTGASQWMDLVEQQTGLRPVIYLNAYYLRLGWPASAKRSPLWLAGMPDVVAYSHALPASVPVVPNGWTVVANQWTDQGTLPGYSGGLDLNVFFGDHTQWAAIAGTKTPTPTPTPEDWFDMATVDDLKAALADVLQNANLVQIGTDPKTGKPVDWSEAHVLTNLRGANTETQAEIAATRADVAALSAKVDALIASLAAAPAQPTNGGTAPSAA